MYLKTLLEELGVEPDRAAIYNLSSAQGQRFAQIAQEMTEIVRALGPSPVKKQGAVAVAAAAKA